VRRQRRTSQCQRGLYATVSCARVRFRSPNYIFWLVAYKQPIYFLSGYPSYQVTGFWFYHARWASAAESLYSTLCLPF
jgi:hypothetical protein